MWYALPPAMQAVGAVQGLVRRASLLTSQTLSKIDAGETLTSASASWFEGEDPRTHIRQDVEMAFKSGASLARVEEVCTRTLCSWKTIMRASWQLYPEVAKEALRQLAADWSVSTDQHDAGHSKIRVATEVRSKR